MKKQSRIIEEMYQSMQALHNIGAVSDEEMQEVTGMYTSYKAPQYSADMIKGLRHRFNMTQVTLASIINASPSSVQQWEQGLKKPSGPSCKLLHLLDTKGLQALI